MEEFDYLKIEAGNKLCVAELINVILSCNHQAMNILLVEYFEKDHAPYEVLKMDKMPFFTLITDPKLVKYINNQFELLDEAFLEVEKLELLKKEILEFKPEDPAYKSKCQELRDHCTNQRFTLQDFRYQEQFKTAFEKLVKDLKELEAANYDEKKKNREKVRGFKDGIARFKTRLANLYCKRLELDHKMYSFANLSLALQCETLKSYFAEYLEKIKFQNFFDIDLRTKVCQFYQDTKDVEEYYPYSPHWPPFKDFIATDKFKRQKMQASFIRLLKAIELALNSTLQIDIQNYFKLIETVLTKIEKMVGFMMARLKTVTFADKHIDVHRYTAACIHHFYALLKKLANIYQEICSGHLKRYFTNFDITSKKQAVEAKKEIISELKARLDSQPEAYFTLEFWNIDVGAFPGWSTVELPGEMKQKARAVLNELVEALAPVRLHFGWRTIDDVLRYLAFHGSLGATDADALDGVVYAKVLPKLRGDTSPRFQKALQVTLEVLRKHRLERCVEKLMGMQEDLKATGSTRFWR